MVLSYWRNIFTSLSSQQASIESSEKSVEKLAEKFEFNPSAKAATLESDAKADQLQLIRNHFRLNKSGSTGLHQPSHSNLLPQVITYFF